MKHGRRRVGQRAQERRAAGGKRAVGRDSVSVEEWTRRVREVYLREGGLCANPACGRPMGDAHHIIKRSQGGSDELTNLIGLCGRCHKRTDAAWEDGRLVVTALVDPIKGLLFTFNVLYSSP